MCTIYVQPIENSRYCLSLLLHIMPSWLIGRLLLRAAVYVVMDQPVKRIYRAAGSQWKGQDKHVHVVGHVNFSKWLFSFLSLSLSMKLTGSGAVDICTIQLRKLWTKRLGCISWEEGERERSCLLEPCDLAEKCAFISLQKLPSLSLYSNQLYISTKTGILWLSPKNEWETIVDICS